MSIGFEVVNDPKDVGIKTSDQPAASVTGYCLWEFDGEQWLMKKDCSKASYQPSAPPAVQGTFRGQLKSLLAVRV